MAALVAVWDCLLRPDLGRYVRPGEKRYSVSVATSQKQASIFLNAARAIVEASELLAPLVSEIRDDEIEFVNRTVIRALPATARGVRGLPVSTLLFDEAAHMVDTDGDASAGPLWRSLAPSLAQFREHARAIVASTPFGAGGWFAEMFERAAAGELAGVAAHHATSAETNPTLDADVLRAEFEADPDGFAAEYEAKFVAGGGAYIDAQRLRECVIERGDLDRLDAVGWVLGADLAFARDPAGIVCVGRDPARPERLRVGLVRRWQPERVDSFEARRAIEDSVLGDLAEIANHYGASVIVDQHLAPAVCTALARLQVRVQSLSLSAETKSLAFAELRARIQAGTIELPDDPDLLAEITGLRSQFRAGRARVTTPRSAKGHSDLAVALALACWAHRLGPSGNAEVYVQPSGICERGNPNTGAPNTDGPLTLDMHF